MINREDMLELTRRMTPSRTSFTRVAGGYMEPDGEINESFNVNFLNLSVAEKEKNLAIAKVVPFAATNVNLRSYTFGDGAEQRKMRQLLYGMRECGLKNDALLYTFYELVGARYRSREPYAILVFHDRYDVPVKASDKERQGESEEVYEYLIRWWESTSWGVRSAGFYIRHLLTGVPTMHMLRSFRRIRNTKSRCLKNYFSHGSRGRLCRKRYKNGGICDSRNRAGILEGI